MTLIRARVDSMREAGLAAKWGKVRGRPALYVRDPNAKSKHQRETWWLFDEGMQKAMTEEGVMEGFHSATLMGDIFSIPSK